MEGQEISVKEERRMLAPREVKIVFSIPEGTLANMRWRKEGPRYYIVGRRKILYDIKDVQEWITRQVVVTSER